jgi:segregation and condensation protein A
MTLEPLGRSLSDFTVELDVYSGPYEWLLALILKDELEIFEIPLRELVESYLFARQPDAANGLERDRRRYGRHRGRASLARGTRRKAH